MSAVTTASDIFFQSRPKNLAIAFQEVLTAIVRLRSNRQAVSDAQTFRTQMLEALNLASSEARDRGYSQDIVRLGVFALVAFVDESVLNQQIPAFADWSRKPLQEELFGVHVAGEIFFENVRRLLNQNDSTELTDVLEMYQLCLLLGYRGRYGSGSQGELRAILQAIEEKIRRTRGASADLSPQWKLPKDEKSPSQSDPWARPLFFLFVSWLAIAVLLWIGFGFSLRSGVSAVKTIAAEARR